MENHPSRYNVYRAMLDDGIRVSQTMNDPNGNIPNNGPNALVFANGINNAEIPTITLTHVCWRIAPVEEYL
jgi:predicted regulator of amino acid metabolism with ACT domain